MILTVTLNPAIDISYPLDHLAIDTTNRVSHELKTAGGKGLNVSRVLHLLNKEVLATGLIGGHLGKFIEKALDKQHIPHAFYETNQESRICIAILHDKGQQTEILEGGPNYRVEDEVGFLTKFSTLIESTAIDVMTISGSLPHGLSSTIYSQMIKLAQAKDIKVLLDCSGNTLSETIAAEDKPYLIKPNTEEIQGILPDEPIETEADLVNALARQEFKGIPWVIVSRGAQGALAKIEEQYYRVTIPRIDVVNPVGSGDATIAGLASALEEQLSVEDCLKTAMTTGILNTLEKQTGYIKVANFNQYFQQVKVEQIQ